MIGHDTTWLSLVEPDVPAMMTLSQGACAMLKLVGGASMEDGAGQSHFVMPATQHCRVPVNITSPVNYNLRRL